MPVVLLRKVLNNMAMYALASQLKNLPVMSIQTGQAIAHIEEPLINMANLEAMALKCNLGRRSKPSSGVILLRDVRQFSGDCIIVDSFGDIEDPSEIVRLKDVVEAGFNPMGRNVVNESGDKLGKVEDYTINLKTYMIQKLYIHQSLVKSLMYNSLVVDRTQVIDVTPKTLTVKDARVKKGLLEKKTIPAKGISQA